MIIISALLCIDYALVASKNDESILRNYIVKYFELKEESIGLNIIYLTSFSRKLLPEKNLEAYVFSSFAL